MAALTVHTALLGTVAVAVAAITASTMRRLGAQKPRKGTVQCLYSYWIGDIVAQVVVLMVNAYDLNLHGLAAAGGVPAAVLTAIMTMSLISFTLFVSRTGADDDQLKASLLLPLKASAPAQSADLWRRYQVAQVARELQRIVHMRLRPLRVCWIALAAVHAFHVDWQFQSSTANERLMLGALVWLFCSAAINVFAVTAAAAWGAVLADVADKPATAQTGLAAEMVEYGINAAAAVLKSNASTKLRIVIVSIGTRGDVQPCVGLALALKARGHHPAICTITVYKSLVEQYGVEFIDCGVHDIVHDEAWHNAANLGELLAANAKGNHTLPVMMAGFLRAVLGDGTRSKPTADVMLGSLTTFHHLMDIRDALQNIPCWALKFQTDVPSSAVGPLSAVNTSRWGWVNYARHAFNVLQIVSAASKVGQSAVQSNVRSKVLKVDDMNMNVRYQDCVHSPTLFAFSAFLQPKPMDWPLWHWPSGFLMLDAPSNSPIPENVRRFFEGKAPVVCVTFGSMMPHWGPELVANAVAAVLACGYKCFFISGGLGDRVQVPPDSDQILTVPSIPHEQVFGRCAAVVHHGGSGTTARCLNAGTPTIAVPILLWADQPFWAAKLEENKCGVAIHSRQPTAAQLMAAIRKCVSNPEIRAATRRAQEFMAAEDSTGCVALAMETCLCDRMLSSAARSQLETKAANPAAKLSAVEQMCVRHCVQCVHSRPVSDAIRRRHQEVGEAAAVVWNSQTKKLD